MPQNTKSGFVFVGQNTKFSGNCRTISENTNLLLFLLVVGHQLSDKTQNSMKMMKSADFVGHRYREQITNNRIFILLVVGQFC